MIKTRRDGFMNEYHCSAMGRKSESGSLTHAQAGLEGIEQRCHSLQDARIEGCSSF